MGATATCACRALPCSAGPVTPGCWSRVARHWPRACRPGPPLFEVIGFDIPDTVEVELHEESLTQIHLTIPASEALSDADLELVAGAGWEFGGGASTRGGCSYTP